MSAKRKAHFAQQEFTKIGKTVAQMLSDGYTRKYIYLHFTEKNEITMSYRAFLRYARKLHLSSCTSTSNLVSSIAKPPLGTLPPLLRDVPKAEANTPYKFQANPDADRLLKVHVKSEE